MAIIFKPVPCPQCGHDLRGIVPVEGLYRCPECGVISNLASIADARKRREGVIWRIAIGAVVLLIIILYVVLRWVGSL